MTVIIIILVATLINIFIIDMILWMIYNKLTRFINEQTTYLSNRMTAQNCYVNPILEKIMDNVRLKK